MGLRKTKPRDGKVTDATATIQARHRSQNRRRAWRVALIALAVVLVGLAVWIVWFSPVFAARSVDISGHNLTDPSEIRAAAQIELGLPLARLDVGAVHDRVVALPAIADAEISRDLSGVVRVKVTERTPVFILPVDGRYQMVDGTGVGFLMVDALPPDLPVVMLDDSTPERQQRLMRDAATVVTHLPASVGAQLASVAAQTPDTFILTLMTGAQILWGSAEESELKAQVIAALINTPASFYDISSPDHPATR